MIDNPEIGGDISTLVPDAPPAAAAPTADAQLESLVAPELMAPAPDPVKTPPEGKGADAPPPPAATPKGTEKQPPADPGAPRPYADLEASLSTRYGREIKLPEGTTKENLAERIEAMFTPKLHPDLIRAQRDIDNGVPPAQALAKLGDADRLLNLSEADLMREHYRSKYGKTDQRPNGWDEAKIESVVKSHNEGELALKAQEVRDAIQQEKAAHEAESAQFSGAKAQYRDPQWRAGYEKSLEKTFDEVVGTDNRLYGLDLSKAGAKDILLRTVKESLMPDQNSGLGGLAKRLQADPKLMIRLALLEAMANKGLINKQLVQRAEQGKGTVMDLLDTTPPAGRSSQEGQAGAVDLDALAAPQTFRR